MSKSKKPELPTHAKATGKVGSSPTVPHQPLNHSDDAKQLEADAEAQDNATIIRWADKPYPFPGVVISPGCKYADDTKMVIGKNTTQHEVWLFGQAMALVETRLKRATA
jgi:hypothetical protein